MSEVLRQAQDERIMRTTPNRGISMPRTSPSAININPNVRCLRIYPTELTKKSVAELKTVGLKLSQDQAVHLARVLLAAAQDWQEIDLTAYRFTPRRSDGTYQLTVTSQRP